MFDTLERQNLNKLTEGKVGNFAAPEAFHAVKVQGLGRDKVKPFTQVRGKFPMPTLMVRSRKKGAGIPPKPTRVGSPARRLDEVRISMDVRYDVDKKGVVPRGKFKDDAKTVALWHFDEPGGTRKFSDASGNAYHLVGENGAKTGNPLAVEAKGKLATLWGRLKQ